MKKIEIGKKVKNFTLESTNKEDFNLKDNLEGYLVLFFYYGFIFELVPNPDP